MKMLDIMATQIEAKQVGSSLLTNTLSSWQGKTRKDCIDICRLNHYECVQFAHWLAMPTLNLLLIFRHQTCIAVEKYC